MNFYGSQLEAKMNYAAIESVERVKRKVEWTAGYLMLHTYAVLKLGSHVEWCTEGMQAQGPEPEFIYQ